MPIKAVECQQLHERIRVHSMAASKVIKEEGGENDLLDRISADPAFGVTLEELKTILQPEKYVGRAPEQTEEFIRNMVQPVYQKCNLSEIEEAEIGL